MARHAPLCFSFHLLFWEAGEAEKPRNKQVLSVTQPEFGKFSISELRGKRKCHHQMCRRRNNGANSATGKMKMKLKLKLESRTWLSVLWSQFRWQRGVCAICDKLPFVGTFFWHCFKVRQKPEMRTWPTFCIKCLLKSCLPLLFNLPAPDSGFWPDFKWPRYLMEMIDSHPYRSGMRPKFSANSNSGLSWLGSGAS